MNKFRVLLLCMLTLLLAGCDNNDEYATQLELLTSDGSVIEGILERRYDLGVSIDKVIAGTDNTSAFATLDKDGSTYQVIVEHDTGIVYDKYGKVLYEEEIERMINEALDKASSVPSNNINYNIYYVYSMSNEYMSSIEDYINHGYVNVNIEFDAWIAFEELWQVMQTLNEYNIKYEISQMNAVDANYVITSETPINSVEDLTDYVLH